MPRYAPSQGGAIRQGEIVSNILQVHVDLTTLTGDGGDYSVEENTQPFAIVVTQDCDLDWDYKARFHTEADQDRQEMKKVSGILLCHLIAEERLRQNLRDVGGAKTWDRIKSNRDERYHYFPSISPDEDSHKEGLPAHVADFKRVMTIRAEEMYHRLNLGLRRRSVLQDIYAHQFNHRFAYYLSRVALPDPNETGGDPATRLLT